MNVGEKIKQRRKEKGLTQQKLADFAEVSRNYLALVETDARKPSFAFIEKISRHLEIDTKTLLSDESKIREIRERILKKFGGIKEIEGILAEIR